MDRSPQLTSPPPQGGAQRIRPARVRQQLFPADAAAAGAVGVAPLSSVQARLGAAGLQATSAEDEDIVPSLVDDELDSLEVISVLESEVLHNLEEAIVDLCRYPCW